MIDLSIPRIMLDLETMSSEPNAGILTIGAVQFGNLVNVEASPQFYMKANAKSSELLGLHIDHSTMQWWDKQDKAVRDEAFSGTESLATCLIAFHQWVESIVGKSKVEEVELWSKGSDFDIPILKYAFYHICGYYPFNFRKARCYRTLSELMPAHLRKLAEDSYFGPSHTAISDAKRQAVVANVALGNMNFMTGVM